VTDPSHPSYGRFLRGDEAGLAGGTPTDFVLVAAGKPQLVGSIQTAPQADGIDLFFEGTINNIPVKSSLKELLDEALKLS
jgi:hypothetical protein